MAPLTRIRLNLSSNRRTKTPTPYILITYHMRCSVMNSNYLIFQPVTRLLESSYATIPNACMQAVDAISTMTAETTVVKQTVVSRLFNVGCFS